VIAVLALASALAIGPAEAGPYERHQAPADSAFAGAGFGASFFVGAGFSRPGQSAEVISEIRVQGNLIVPNDEVVAIAGVSIGDPFQPDTIDRATARLQASKKFDQVQVLKRFASIEDRSKIAVVIIVNEGPVRLTSKNGSLTIVRRRGVRNLMVLPILDVEDGYGFTYGARLALAGAVGPQSRIAFPLTWGGTKQAAVEVDRPMRSGPLTRLELGAGVQRQTNPAFLIDDDRQRAWLRLERATGPVRLHGTAGWQHVTFGDQHDRFRSVGADAAFDTRRDPVLPRNAVFATAGWERLDFASGGAVTRTQADGRAYIGLVGQTVLAVRAIRESSDSPLPPYLKSLLGGWSTLRGYDAGSFAGDTLVAESVELRVPLNSTLHLAKVGVSAFVDNGTAYDSGQRFQDQVQHRSIGGTVWFAATVFHLGVAVARASDGGTRVNFGGGLTF
jgi:outer membrane protein assembly factor BamA